MLTSPVLVVNSLKGLPEQSPTAGQSGRGPHEDRIKNANRPYVSFRVDLSFNLNHLVFVVC